MLKLIFSNNFCI